MRDHLVIAIVVFLALGAHIWIFRWVRFKVDEGSILKLLEDSGNHLLCTSEAISSEAGISARRVSRVCAKSKLIETSGQEQASWRLKKAESVLKPHGK